MSAAALLAQAISFTDENKLRWFCNEAVAIFERSTAGAMIDNIVLFLPHLIRQEGHEYGMPANEPVLGSHGQRIGERPALTAAITSEFRNVRGFTPDQRRAEDWYEYDSLLRRVAADSSPTLANALRVYYGPLGEQWTTGHVSRLLLSGDTQRRGRHTEPLTTAKAPRPLSGHTDRLCALYHLVPEGLELITEERAAAARAAQRARLVVQASETAELDGGRRKHRRKERRAEDAQHIASALVEVTDEKAMIAILHARRARGRGAKLAKVRASAYALRAAAWQAWGEARWALRDRFKVKGTA